MLEAFRTQLSFRKCLLNECVTSDRSFRSSAFCLPQLAHLEMGRLVLQPQPQALSWGPVPTLVPRVLSFLGEALTLPAPPPPSPNPKLPADGAVLELFHLAQCTHRPNPLLNDTLLPSTDGGEGAGPTRLWFLFPRVQQNSWEAFSLLGQLPCMPQSLQEVFRMWCWFPSCLVYRGTPGVPSSCGVFMGAHTLVISCSVSLCAVDLLGCLSVRCLQGSRLASSLPQQKVLAGRAFCFIKD